MQPELIPDARVRAIIQLVLGFVAALRRCAVVTAEEVEEPGDRL